MEICFCEGVKLEILIVIVFAIVLYFYWGVRRGTNFFRHVGTVVARRLYSRGESKETIAALLYSVTYIGLVKSSFGKMTREQTIEQALYLFDRNAEHFRRVGPNFSDKKILAKLPMLDDINTRKPQD
jgi:branched-subunit amino acid ABC-type transport system permease component